MDNSLEMFLWKLSGKAKKESVVKRERFLQQHLLACVFISSANSYD